MKKKREPWYRKFFVNALLWLAAKILQPIPVVGVLAEFVCLAV